MVATGLLVCSGPKKFSVTVNCWLVLYRIPGDSAVFHSVGPRRNVVSLHNRVCAEVVKTPPPRRGS